MSTLLDVRALDLAIGPTQVCRALDLRIEAGQCWALLGRNGVGKTTLLHHLAGLLRGPAAARIELGGTPIGALEPRARARRVSVLLQHSDPGFGASVLETVLTGRHPYLGPLAWEADDDLVTARRCIAATCLDGLAERPLDALSGGELRRVEIARLLAQACPLALLDEPLNHLDVAHQAGILQLLRERCVGDDRAMLMVLHDLDVAYRACDQWLLLDGDGAWHSGPRAQLADAAVLSHTFGHPITMIDTDQGPLFRPRL